MLKSPLSPFLKMEELNVKHVTGRGKYKEALGCPSVKWRLNVQLLLSPGTPELQRWLTTTLINISFAIGSKLEQQSTEPQNTNPKAEHTRNKPTAQGWLGVRNRGFHWGGRTCSRHFCSITSSLPIPSLLSVLAPHTPSLRQDWLCAFAMDFEEMQNLQHQGPVQQFWQQTFTKN